MTQLRVHCFAVSLDGYPRESFEMEGGTTFHFVTEGIGATLEQAREAAGDLDDLGDAASRYECTEWIASPRVTHAVLTRVD